MDTTLATTPTTPPVQASPKKNKSHQSPKKKANESPRHTLCFYNSNRENNSGQSGTIEVKRPILVAKRRHPTNVQPESQSENHSSSFTTINAQSSTHKFESQASLDRNPPNNYVCESRVVETFKAFQREQGHQNSRSPRKGQRMHNSILAPKPGRREKFKEFEEIPDLDANRKVLVSGFPAYTQSQDLSRVLSELGPSQILRCRNRLAVVLFETEELAQSALECSDELYIYGEFIQIYPYTNATHVDNLFRSYKKVITKKKGLDIIEPSKIDLSGDFSQQFENIQNAVRLTHEEVMEITQLYVDVEAVFNPVWPGCRAIPFGSVTTGLGIKSSDADCFVEGVSQARGGSATFVTRARRALSQRPDLFSQLVSIPRANTPIVKFLHIPTKRHCDVSAKTPLGSLNSRLIQHILKGDPRLSPLAVCIKYWSKVHELTGTGRLANYALAMMIIFYLQQPHIALAPSVERLQRDPTVKRIVDHWNAGFEPRTDLIQSNSSSMDELLGGFFKFYAEFDFEKLVVCPLTGVGVPKASFERVESLPPQMERYVRNVANKLVSPLRHSTAFCVQDPFELSHNVASSVSQKLAEDIREYIKYAALAADTPQFLHTILLSKPKLERRNLGTTRIFLIPRIRGEIVDSDWRGRVRDVLLDKIFTTILKIKLEKDDGEESLANDERTADMDKERYQGYVTKPVWRRKNSNWSGNMDDDLILRNEEVTTHILTNQTMETPVRFQLELGFGDAPVRTCYLLLKLVQGDMDAFKGFVRFFHSTMFDWFRTLLKPFLKFDKFAEQKNETERKDRDVTKLLASVSLADKADDS